MKLLDLNSQQATWNFLLRNHWIALALTTLCFIHFFLIREMTLDDAFIYLRTALNFADGEGFVINPGEKTFNVTSPVWALICGIGAFMYTGSGLIEYTKFMFAFILAAAAFISYLSLKKHLGISSILMIPLLFFLHLIVPTIGMELSLVYLCVFAVLYFWEEDRIIPLGIFLGLSYLTRAELGLMLIPMVVMDIVRDQNIFKVLKKYVSLSLIALPIAILWHVYLYLDMGELLPSTLKIKQMQLLSGWGSFEQMLLEHLIYEVRTYLIVDVIGFVLLWKYYKRGLLFLLVFAVLQIHAYLWIGVPDYHWYLYSYALITTMLGFLAFPLTIKYVSEIGSMKVFGGKIHKKLMYSVLTIFFLVGFWYYEVYANFLLFPDVRKEVITCSAEALEGLVENDDVIFASEIGLLSFLYPNNVMRDMAGLATNIGKVSHYNRLDSILPLYEPDFVILTRYHYSDALSRTNFTGVEKVLEYEILDIDGVSRQDYNGEELSYCSQLMRIINVADRKQIEQITNEIIKNGIGPDFGLRMDETKGSVIFAHAPSASKIQIPDSAVQFSIGYGALNNENLDQSDGVIYIISSEGLNGNIDTLIIHELNSNEMNQGGRLVVDLRGQELDSLALRIDQKSHNEYDWTFWHKPVFEYE